MKNGFTLMELMVVVTIAGIVAGFGIPNYTKTLDRAAGQDAFNNLKVIAAAQQAYWGTNGEYYPSTVGTVNLPLINSNLYIHIINQQGIVYECGTVVGECTATKGAWTYKITLPDQLPACSAGLCPYP